MQPQKHHFLFVLLLTFIVRSQVLSPISNCLGNCTNCVSNDLAVCTGSQPCEWGFYSHQQNSSCILAPSKQIVWAQLGEKSGKNSQSLSESWGEYTKHSTCQYSSPMGKRRIDVLGLYSGVTMLEKTFPIDSNSQVLSLSFNLLRDEWMPFNDFLLIDISSKDETLSSIEISYQKRVKVESQAAIILCSGKRVLSEKFNIKIVNNNNFGNSLTLVFTSFLYNSQWGLSNLKIVAGCTQFTTYDSASETCSICDTDSYQVLLGNSEKSCEKCPSLCRSCVARNNCTACLDGAVLVNGTCAFSDSFKTQQMVTTGSSVSCGAYSYDQASSQKIVFKQLKNLGNQLFDEIQLSFRIHYTPADWPISGNNKIIIKFNKVDVFVLTAANLTNKGTVSCSENTLPVAVIEILTPKKIQNDNAVNVTFEYVGKDKQPQFGVSNLSLKSIKKQTHVEPNVTVIMPQLPPKVIQEPEKIAPQVVASPANNVSGQDNEKKQQYANVSMISNATTPQLTSSNQTIDNATVMEEIIIPIVPQVPTKLEQQAILPNKTLPAISETSDINEVIKQMTTLSPKNVTPQANNTVAPAIHIQDDFLVIDQPEKAEITSNLQAKKQAISNLSIILPTNTTSTMSQTEKAAPAHYSQASYVPSSNSDKSGLHLVITQPADIDNCRFSADIDKLDSTSYSINDTYILDGDLHLFLAISNSFIDATITVYKQPLTARMLQTSKATVVAVVSVSRYDSLSSSQLASISAFATVFKVLAWFGAVGIIVAVLCGYGVVVEEYVLCLQMIFLHAYIAADYIPLTFRDVIGGLSNIQNLNFLLPSHGLQIEKQWLGNVVQNGPVRFFLFNTDINFTRQFYPIIIINIAYLGWFAALVVARKYLLRRGLMQEEKHFFHRAVDNIVCRPINYIDQIWRYQFLATIWLCFLQFYNLKYPSGSDRSQALNAALCILSLIATLAWPAFLGFYSRKYYYENEYSDYLYKFQDVHYRRIPEFYLPSNHHRFGYPLLRAGKTFLTALIIAYLGSIASLTLVLLILLQLAEIGYAKYHQIYCDGRYFAHRLIENVLFCLIELILLFLCSFSSLALTESYIYIGFVLASLCLLLALNALARTADLASHKHREATCGIQWQLGVKQPKTQRVV